jgi:hypothetical protein
MSTLTEQFLAWVAARPRSYAEAMEAWRSTCPRLSIWEDALGDDLVRLEPGAGGLSECRVVLTPHGEALLSVSDSTADVPRLPAAVSAA